MGVFVDFRTGIAASSGNPDLSVTPTTIIEAVDNTLIVNDICVCNIGDQPIRLNLQLQQVISSVTTTSYRLKNILITPNGTINLMKRLVDQTAPNPAGDTIFLEGDPTASVVSRLLLFTNGYSQVCNCTVGYTILLETPWGGPCG